MTDYRYISIKVLIDRIMERPLFSSLELDNAIRWTIWCLGALNNPQFYHKKIANIDIDRYRGKIPYDFFRAEKIEIIETSEYNSNKRESMLQSGDPFLKDKINRNNPQSFKDTSYNIEGNYIFVEFEEGKVQMAYWAMPLDTNGYIMIPDNPKVIQAIMSYIKYRHLEILNDLGQVDYGKVEKEEQNYDWYIGQAQSEHFMDNLDSAETMRNIISQLYPDRNQHRTGYRDLGDKEYIRKH